MRAAPYVGAAALFTLMAAAQTPAVYPGASGTAAAQQQTGPRFIPAPDPARPSEPTDGTAAQPSAGSPGQISVQPLGPPGVQPPTQPGLQGGQDGWRSDPENRFKQAPERPDPSLNLAPRQAVPINTPPTEMRSGARLRELDKMSGRTETFDVAVGSTRQVGRLKISLEACRSPEGNDTHGSIAFLKVWDTRHPDKEAFSGWMFAESPSLSALDHPRYDLWVISCTISDVATSSPSE